MTDLSELLKQLMKPNLNREIGNFRRALEPTDRQSDLVAARQNAVRTRVVSQANFEIERSFLYGSYSRDTQIRPSISGAKSLDVDCMLVLKPNDRNLNKFWNIADGGTFLLDQLFRAMDGYQGITARIDRPCVSLSWSDMTMEITPAFSRKGGGLFIPSRTDGGLWIYTDPEADSEAFTAANKDCESELVPMVKILKCWNRYWHKPFSSFQIESIACLTARYGYRKYPFEIPWFFRKALEMDGKIVDLPSGVGEPMHINLSSTDKRILLISDRFASKAFDLAKQEKHEDAIEFMGMIFGKPFKGAKD